MEREFALNAAESYLADAVDVLTKDATGRDIDSYAEVTARAAVAAAYAALAQVLPE